MPPRLPALQRLGSSNLCLGSATRSAPNFLPIVQTANLSQREKERKAKGQRDPYRYAQAQQRRNANLKRQEELQKAKADTWGDPIWGKSSAFVESFDKVGTAEGEPPVVGGINLAKAGERLPAETHVLRNHYVTDAELESAIQQGFDMTKPVASMFQSQSDPATEAERVDQHKKDHQRAVEVLKRITALENGSAADRRRVNVQRVIDELGRHRTDKYLKPKPKSIHASTDPVPIRAGPDTGSSEVQIGILTAKIRGLAHALQGHRAYKDKHNRRNLRLLLHRRQKLLRYMERKERGGERWTNMLEKLGLTPATWKGQIEM
ncbi:hypothetical protein B0I35DRAFT_478353 [Stachybotrys elegans]|uniref:Ribosomal protein S15 n=1 Tax=Stachybotrys elegans TaxID=80388 RepID=A0A8K0SSZ2_9HYPO|nr:hypothetical protein B0I35DRAFT_478353 [Stachybotrys elegans]